MERDVFLTQETKTLGGSPVTIVELDCARFGRKRTSRPALV
jgi:hypothetical protein